MKSLSPFPATCEESKRHYKELLPEDKSIICFQDYRVQVAVGMWSLLSLSLPLDASLTAAKSLLRVGC